MAEPIDTGWPAGFDPFVHWAGRFGLRRAIKRLALGKSGIRTEWRYWRAARRLPDGRSGTLRAGASLLGCHRAENGIGESCRLAAEALACVGSPFGVVNMPFSLHCRHGDTRTAHHEIPWPAHRANVLHMNAPEMGYMGDLLGRRGLAGRITIAVWHWELPTLPLQWKRAMRGIDEFWAPSRFIEGALRDGGAENVVAMPHGVAVPPGAAIPRSELGVADDSYLFLVMYDVASYQRRKNPEGAIRAFKRAFSPDGPATLLVKLHNAHFEPGKTRELAELASGWPSIRLLTDVFDRERTRGLLRACDCYVSLHRSEGFGLGPAEALALGKPVIATDWSSTTDFVHPDHACPVACRLVPVGETVGPYEAWQHWAEPDLDDAAEAMRRLAADPEAGRALGKKAAAFMAARFHPRQAGERMRRRLEELGAIDA